MLSDAAARLTRMLEAEGLDALAATNTETLYDVTGFRSISHALFRGAVIQRPKRRISPADTWPRS